MSLHAVQNRSLADQIFEQIAGEILDGLYKPDTTLPSERSLAEVFGVNRHVVREALKRLEQIHLVKVSQGGGTHVLDYRKHAGLDLLPLMAKYARGAMDVAKYWLAVLEMRAAIAPDVSRLCALRASRAIKDELVAIANQMSEASDARKLFDLEVRFWDSVIEGADNLAYRLAFNSLLKGTRTAPDLAVQWSLKEVKASGYRQPIAAAIAAEDAEKAETETRAAMRATMKVLGRMIAPTSVQSAKKAASQVSGSADDKADTHPKA